MKKLNSYDQLVAQRKRAELAPKIILFFVALFPVLMVAHVIGQKLAGGV